MSELNSAKGIDTFLQSEMTKLDFHESHSDPSPPSSAATRSPGSSPPCPSSQSSLSPPRYDGISDSFLQSQAQLLPATERLLFNHYLEHTSKDATVGSEEQYILQIGIPTLAFQHRLLMSSVLAFSAVCKCCDIISQPSISQTEREQIQLLLSIADRYHMQSLRGIQTTLSETKQYDHILANASMMGMYGSSSHRIRIWLSETASFDDPDMSAFVPKSCQWMSLFRAVRVAYTGLLNDKLKTEDVVQLAAAASPTIPMATCDFSMQCKCKSSQVDQQKSPQDHALYPILAATVAPALERLTDRAGEVGRNDIGDYGYLNIPGVSSSSDIQACFVALELFKEIVSETFFADESVSSTSDFDIDVVGQASKVSPWMRRYTAKITSMIPSNLPRRFIMAFIHKAPTRYLNLVEDMMGLIQTGASSDNEMALNLLNPVTLEPTLAHQFAVDIFAHWLVLVILLDKVWWIGGIGAWELRQIVSFKQDVRWHVSLWETDQDWWPESMFEISRQFGKHRGTSCV